MPFVLSLLGNWRVMLALIIAIFAGIIMWKFKALENDLNHSREALKIEQSNNQVLRNNLDQAGQINADNAKVLEAVEADRKRALEAVSQLNTDLQKTNKNIDAIKQKINGITTPPSKLTPYLVESVKGVQELRDAENPPAPPAPAAAPASPPAPLKTNPNPPTDSKKVVTIPRPQ